MKRGPFDAERAVIDLAMFFHENPTYRMGSRFIWLLAKILMMQLDDFAMADARVKKTADHRRGT